MMEVPILRIPFSLDDKQEITTSISQVLDSGHLTMGKYTREFDERFTAMAGDPYSEVGRESQRASWGTMQPELRLALEFGREQCQGVDRYCKVAIPDRWHQGFRFAGLVQHMGLV